MGASTADFGLVKPPFLDLKVHKTNKNVSWIFSMQRIRGPTTPLYKKCTKKTIIMDEKHKGDFRDVAFDRGGGGPSSFMDRFSRFY